MDVKAAASAPAATSAAAAGAAPSVATVTSAVAAPDFVLEPYSTAVSIWPKEGQHILAQYHQPTDSVVVYQAFSPAIGHYAAKHQRFQGCPVSDLLSLIFSLNLSLKVMPPLIGVLDDPHDLDQNQLLVNSAHSREPLRSTEVAVSVG
jgi:hypothetical protein